jgi:hypothetical protein
MTDLLDGGTNRRLVFVFDGGMFSHLHSTL